MSTAALSIKSRAPDSCAAKKAAFVMVYLSARPAGAPQGGEEASGKNGAVRFKGRGRRAYDREKLKEGTRQGRKSPACASWFGCEARHERSGVGLPSVFVAFGTLMPFKPQKSTSSTLEMTPSLFVSSILNSSPAFPACQAGTEQAGRGRGLSES